MKTNTTSENVKTALVLLVLLLLYGLVGRMDYEDEVMREAESNSYYYHHHQGEQQ